MPFTTALRLRPHARDEDRARIIHVGDTIVVVVVDGAGGMPGGAEAADLAVAGVEHRAGEIVDPEHAVALLLDLDTQCEHDPRAGEAACVIVTVTAEGRTFGASVGDCEAWVVSGDQVTRLTDQQHKKKRLGSGRAEPVAFEAVLQRDAAIVVGSEGLFGYVSQDKVVVVSQQETAAEVADALVAAALAPPVVLADDLAVVVLRL